MASVCASAVSVVLSGSVSRPEAHASGAQELRTSFLGSSLRRHPNAAPMVRSRSGRSGSPVAMATKKDSKDPNSVRNAVLGLGGAAVIGFFAYLLTPDDIGASAAVTLTPTTGNEVTGTVVFTELTSHFGAQYVKVDVDLAGLTPGRHGFHVHDKGNVTCGDGLCTGGHFNPEGKPHAGPKSSVRHVGDLGNVVAEADGTVKFSFLDSVIKLEGEKSIVGRSVVVHAAPDDLTSQPTGNAGGRVAYGTISLV